MARFIDGELYLSTQDIAGKVGVSTRTVLRWVKKGITLQITKGKGKPKEVKLTFLKDPISGYHYLKSDQVDLLVDQLKKTS